VVAALAVWLLLTDPLAVTKALTAHDVSTLANTAAGALQDLAVRLLR
jgi:hypothetical protein